MSDAMGSLDPFLRPADSPIVQNTGGVPSYYFQSQNERNAISLTRIKNFNFSSGTGGTLTLGGASNGNGLMLVKNASGSTVVRVDNAGISVTGGSISVTNDSGQVTLDAKGIVSNSNNFITTDSISGGGQDFTSGTITDVTGSTLSFSTTRTQTLLILCSIGALMVESVGNTGDGFCTADLDGSDSNAQMVVRSGNNYDRTTTAFAFKSISAGSHTLKLKAELLAIYAGAPIFRTTGFHLSYILLGT